MARLKRDKHGLRIKVGVCKECMIPRKPLNHYGVCQECRDRSLQARQAAYNNAVHDLYSDIRMPGRLEILHAQGFSWRFIAAELGNGITPADLSRLARGIAPKDPKKCAALGLPIMKPAPVCPGCGQVHVAKRCPEKRRAREYRDLWEMPEGELLRRLKERG